VSAADLPLPSADDGSAALWIVTVGVMTQYGPDFAGAKTYGFNFAPQFSFRREGESAGFSAPDDGIDYAVYDTPTLKIGPVGTIDRGRSAGADHALQGLDNFSWRVEAGAYVEFWPVQDVLRTRLEMLHGLRSRDGASANLAADLVRQYGALTVSAGPRLVLADDDAMQFQFGVSPKAAERNGRVSAFDASAGFQSVGANATLGYDWSQDWRFTVFGRYDRLVGDAADSPITRELGSADQFTVGAGITYSFRVGD
jgi:outer membrane scaffolding protein for murein synthesis (MipA/OmpV family)